MLRQKTNFPKTHTSGFTIMELIVAMAIFTVVMTVVLTTYLNINLILKRTASFRVVADNLNFALESMSREIRTGVDYNYTVASPKNGTFSELSFKDYRGDVVTYKFYGAPEYEIRRKIGTGDEFTITAPEARVTELRFIVDGVGNEAAGSEKQPMVTIALNAEAGVERKVYFNLQTTIVQRRLEL